MEVFPLRQGAQTADTDGAMHGCLFCKSGSESEIVRKFEFLFPGSRAIVPLKTRYRRMGGEAREEDVPMLPGYVFFETEQDLNLRKLLRTQSVYRLLCYGDGDWRLHGSDDQFAALLFGMNGNIGISKAFYDEGERIRVIDGLMKEYEGFIIRVNRRARTAEIRIPFQDKQVSMWLGFELIDKVQA